MTMERLREESSEWGIPLSTRQVDQFTAFTALIQEWNQRFNLTRITATADIETGHFLDSLSIFQALVIPSPRATVMDMGSGAGLPGIPLQIVCPDWKVTLLEATAKKVHFLEHVKEQLGLTNLEVIWGRAETLAHQEGYRESFNLVVSRAVAPLVTLVELTLPFCRTGGVFIALKKGDLEAEIATARRATSLLNGRLREPKDILSRYLSGGRKLVIIDKMGPTPRAYPRTPGLPAKSPLM
jgi:16S rRNA (guanine527-N7)-methyltransferase